MKVYLCGGINGLSDADAKDWREQAKRLLVGCETADPMRRDYRGVEDMNVHEIVHGDLEDIDGSDVLLAMCPKPSWGTAMEIFYAHDAGKRVFVVAPAGPLSPWLKYHSHRVCPTVEDACEWILMLPPAAPWVIR